MDFTLSFTDFDVLPFDRYDTIHDVLDGVDAHIQYIETYRRPRYRIKTLFAPLTCVEIMKSLLGFTAYTVFSPYQLYKYIEANHGKNIRRRQAKRTI